MRVKFEDKEIRMLSAVFLLLAVLIVGRLFILQVLQYDYYSTFALDSHEIYEKLYPKRGEILFQDTRNGTEYKAATLRAFYTVYAVPSEIAKEEISLSEISSVAQKISEILEFDEEETDLLLEKLNKKDDPYEPIEKKIPEEVKQKIEALDFTGIYFVEENYRYYPEANLASAVLGFYGSDEDGNQIGRYGIEGYFEEDLKGEGGLLIGEKTRAGSLIALASRKLVDPENGKTLLLTIDRTLQFKACERLREGMESYGAQSASLVMMNPKTGAILAMCSLPEFDPNNYSQAESIQVYNNQAIFNAYEPGSIFKPIAMSAALDQELIEPNTVFHDPCERHIGGFTLHNALNQCYGDQTMTGVLENSINTGMIWVEERLGIDSFKKYVEKFGFGKKTGISLSTEVAGDVSSLEQKGPIYGAVASYGQGIMTTPLQLAVAYSTLANNGKMPKPYIVEEIRRPDGKIEKTEPKIIEEVISSRASKLITGMLVSVVDNGQAVQAKVPGFYVAGKTGTAQIAGAGGYGDETNHSFAGFAPAGDPKIVIVVRYEKPQRNWSSSTAAPIFSDIMKFTLDYYGIAKER